MQSGVAMLNIPADNQFVTGEVKVEIEVAVSR